MDRNSEIEKRLTNWNLYRLDLNSLLDWLKEREKERTKLQLRYIHIKRIPRLKQRIENLLETIPIGEEMCKQLEEQQINLLQFCDDALATSVRMEYASVNQRIANLRAALEIWKDFLLKIIQLSQTYDTKMKFLQNEFETIQKLIDNTTKAQFGNTNAIQERLTILRNHRIKLSNLTPELERLNVIQEELKECISPHDMKSIRQMIWILWQQHSDIDLQLSNLINMMEERLSLHSMFLTRYDKIMKWIDEIEKRINREIDISYVRDPHTIAKKLENEIQSEMSLKEKEREWLLSTGRELLSMNDSGSSNVEGIRTDVQYKIDNLIDRWERLKYLCKQRNNKANDLRMTLLRLEERISQIRQWLFEMEIELSKLITINAAEPEAIELLLRDHDKIQRSIEKESGNIGEVLNLCEMLLNDTETWKTNPNISNLADITHNLEKRWKNVCRLSADRKKNILGIWSLLQDVLKLTTDNDRWLKKQINDLNILEKDLNKLSSEQIQNRINDIELKIQEIQLHEPAFKQLQQSYSKLVMVHGLNPETVRNLTITSKQMLEKWHELIPKAYNILEILNKDIRIYHEFMNNHNKAILSLTQLDAELTQIQHLTPKSTNDNNEQVEQQNSENKLKRIENLENELRYLEKMLKKTDELGDETKKRIKKDDIQNIQTLINEYQILWKDIQTRILLIKKEILEHITTAKAAIKLKQLPTEIDECIQVETLKFQQDNATQVNTLNNQQKLLKRMTSITAKDAYLMELESAIKECQDNLNNFEQVINDKTKMPGVQKISKLLASCQSSVELMKHLSTLLVTECSATNNEAQLDIVTNLQLQFEKLQDKWKLRQQQNDTENRYNSTITNHNTSSSSNNRNYRKRFFNIYNFAILILMISVYLHYKMNTQ